MKDVVDCWSLIAQSIIGLLKLLAQTLTFEPAHDKTYSKTSVTSKTPDQPVHPPNMSRILVYSSLKSLKAVEGTCYQ